MSDAKELWGAQIPFNINRSKYDDMKLTKAPQGVVILNWIRWVFGTKLMRDNHGMDDFVDRTQIKKGLIHDTYTDVPTITPYVVPDSKTSVVIAPGGGFCMVSTPNEGVHPAEVLNAAGISAFVINYRLEPYRWPIPCIDMQRAIRWVRHHAAEYGVNPDSVGAMGYSAGGYTALGSAAFLANDPIRCDGYTPDEVDAENGRPDYLIAIYPVTHFEDNPNMLANLKGEGVYTDPVSRARWMKEYSLIDNYDRIVDLPQFMCYGTKDQLKGHEKYAACVRAAGSASAAAQTGAEGAQAQPGSQAEGLEGAQARPNNHVEVLVGAQHGFSGQKKWLAWEDKLTQWIQETTA